MGAEPLRDDLASKDKDWVRSIEMVTVGTCKHSNFIDKSIVRVFVKTQNSLNSDGFLRISFGYYVKNPCKIIPTHHQICSAYFHINDSRKYVMISSIT